MHKPSFDPGLTRQFTTPVTRIINKDGTFNVRRTGGTWRDFHPYLHLINMTWGGFLGTVFLAYVVVNTLFAVCYFLMAPGQLQGADGTSELGRFLNDFFFSAHTLTTVGYGSISPKGLEGNILAALESLTGVLAFAVATGLMYGRVARPSTRLGFSEQMVMAPYQEGQALEFRVLNRRPNSLMEVEAQVMLMTVNPEDGKLTRKYELLKLERPRVLFLALTWTVVHPIDNESPFRNLTAEDLDRLQAEVLIVLKGYDDTFSQTVISRHSYRHDEIVWDRRFSPAFRVDEDGTLVLEVHRISEMA
jgi:inward rectifier potassium channel